MREKRERERERESESERERDRDREKLMRHLSANAFCYWLFVLLFRKATALEMF